MSRQCKHSKLWFYFTRMIFLALMAGFALLLLFWTILYYADIISINPFNRHIPVIMLTLGSIVIGGVVAVYVGRQIIKPMQKINDAFNELSKGNFDVRIENDTKVEEIKEIAKRFNAMVFDLSHVETLRSDFVVNVSHEFKTPIASIEGYATLLQNPSLSQEKRIYYVEKILGNTGRLSKLSSNVLTLSKLENQETVMNKKEYRLDEQLRKAVLLLEDKWSAKNLEFDIELERQFFYGNEQLLDQVWFNLLDNAIKYSPRGETIRVSIDTTPTTVSVTIANNGNGMSEETQKHIFEKFYQGDAFRKTDGNGLGLALVKRIVDLCQGKIAVNSEIGQGTVFTVILPMK